MRSVVMLLLGLVVGAICTTMALRALSQGSEYPEGVMAVMGAHFGALRKALESGTCEAGEMARHADTLRLVAHDIEPAFLPTGGDDDAFRAHAGELREQAAALRAAAAGGCATLAPAVGDVGQACKACHQDFR